MATKYKNFGKPGKRTAAQKEKYQKFKAVKKAGSKINTKEAKSLQKLGLTIKEIQRYTRADNLKFSKGAKEYFEAYSTPYQDPINTKLQKVQNQFTNLQNKYSKTQGYLKDLRQSFKDQKALATEAAKTAQQRFNALRIQSQKASTASQNRFQEMMTDFTQREASSKELFEQQLAEREARFIEQQKKAMAKREADERTFIANQMRAAASDPKIKLGTPTVSDQTYGTGQFKRRKEFLSNLFQGIQSNVTPTIGGINI